MAVRTWRFAALVGVLAALGVAVAGSGSAAVSGAHAANPTIYFMYAMNCTFTIQDDTGKVITSIPPGRYQVDVRTPIVFGTLPTTGPGTDMTACRGVPQFQLTGPGVDLFTNLTAGCESDKIFTETFLPSSTYVAQDLNQPSVARGSFTTLATGTPATPAVTYGGGKGKAELSTDIVGSLAIRATLTGTVGKDGKPTLKVNGKNVTKLKAGRYRFTVRDSSHKLGFKVLGPLSKTPIGVTGDDYVGKHSLAVKLTAGKWLYYTSLGSVHYFRVTS